MGKDLGPECAKLDEEAVVMGLSKAASDVEFQPYLAGWMKSHCAECSRKMHRIERIQELMTLGMAARWDSESLMDPLQAWLEVCAARDRNAPGKKWVQRVAFVVYLLMEEEERLRWNTPGEGLEAMEQALGVMRKLVPDSGRDHLIDSKNFISRRSPPRGLTLRALVEARFGNALRYNSQHPEARPVLARAALMVRTYEVPDLVLAETLWLYGVLLTDSRQHAAALEVAHDSVDGYRSMGDVHRAAIVLMTLADIFYRQNGRAADALQLLDKALADLDPLRSPHMHYGCQLKIVAYSLRAGFVEQADRTWKSLSPSEHETTELQRQSMRGLIFLAKKQFKKSIEYCNKATHGFLELGMANDATLMMLYKGEALLRSGQVDAGLDQLKTAYGCLLTLEISEPEKQSFKDLMRMARAATVEQLVHRIRQQIELMGGCLPKSRRTPAESD